MAVQYVCDVCGDIMKFGEMKLVITLYVYVRKKGKQFSCCPKCSREIYYCIEHLKKEKSKCISQ